ncbi:MAG: AI-2E family transporter [Alphaproteobacteria bacterium]
MDQHIPPHHAATPHADTTHNRGYMAVGVWIIATAALGIVLHWGAEILAPFALAVFVWLVMEGFAREIRRPVPKLPSWVAHLIAVSVVVIAIVVFIGVLRGAVLEFAAKSDNYETRINGIITHVYAMLGLSDAPKLSTLIFSDTTVRFVQPALTTVRGMASDLVLVLIYVAFLYVSSARYPRKIVQIFPHHDTRSHAVAVLNEIRHAMEQYLWVQTVLSIITTALTYVTMLAVGLDNALFWAFVIFVLNYIPTIGSIVAAILPALFAIAQPIWPSWMPTDPLWCALIVFFAVSVWQFAIGNFMGPRMTGSSLNISALVVLLSLALWGALWGLTGMFLSAPLTVLVMIVLAQIPGARWIAILLSEDGRPDYLAPPERGEPEHAEILTGG